jgi:hypothetical protein
VDLDSTPHYANKKNKTDHIEVAVTEIKYIDAE